jgi:pimeloyl-ACP methyl ester carboxylesterase
MGGFGTWSLGSHHADRFAALAVSCGAPTSAWSSSSDPGDEVDGMIPNLRNLPIVFYHGADDRRVAPDASRRAAGRMAAARERWGAFDFEYWEEAGRGHSGPPGGMGALLERIADREREARPQRLVWQPALDWKRQFYWLWSERPGSPGLVEAELDQESGILRIDSDALAGLWVLLDDDLLDLERGLTLILNGGEPRAVLPLRNLAVIARTGRGGDDALTFEAAVVVSP